MQLLSYDASLSVETLSHPLSVKAEREFGILKWNSENI